MTLTNSSASHPYDCAYCSDLGWIAYYPDGVRVEQPCPECRGDEL